MSPPPPIRKGDRIRAHWLKATDASLSGTQPKFGLVGVTVIGRITHIRGDHPTHPTSIRVWVQPDEGPEVIIHPDHIVAVLERAST